MNEADVIDQSSFDTVVNWLSNKRQRLVQRLLQLFENELNIQIDSADTVLIDSCVLDSVTFVDLRVRVE